MFARMTLLTVLAALSLAGPAAAADLQVSPALVDVTAPQAASTLLLETSGPEPVTVQIRTFRWTQENGVERLTPTRDVVASPPAAQLEPGRNQLVRIVRVSRAPVRGEESYRLLVDQLPSRGKPGSVAVKLLVRHSIPVFFGDGESRDAAVKWTVTQRGGAAFVAATNGGEKRLRVAGLKLEGAGPALSFGNGLLGYVLGGSTMVWQVPGPSEKLRPGRAVRLVAQGSAGPIKERIAVSAR